MPQKIRINMIGRIAGRLSVISFSHINHSASAVWNCQCSCGCMVKVVGNALRSGETKSCGCWSRDVVIARNTKHNDAKRGQLTKEYRAWNKMKERCFSANCKEYRLYGAKGVVVCAKWKNSFAEFLKDIGRAPTPNHSIDRFPNKCGNYEPGNVRWATDLQQANNKRNNRMVTWRGQKMTLADLSRLSGMNYSKLKKRLNRWNNDAECALSQ